MANFELFLEPLVTETHNEHLDGYTKHALCLLTQPSAENKQTKEVVTTLITQVHSFVSTSTDLTGRDNTDSRST